METPVVEFEDIDGLRQTLSSYKPGSTRNLVGHGFSRVCLQLFGLGGDGKSSLINSCLCVVHNLPFSNEAGAGTSSDSFTTARNEYKLTDTVYITDNRGLHKQTKDERLELSAQLRNLRSLSNVDWNFELERTVNQLEERYNYSTDFIVPVWVYSFERPLSKDAANEFSLLLRDAFEITGIFPVVVLTKSKGKYTAGVLKEMENLGCQHMQVLNNYTTANSTRSAETDSEVLRFLHMCLQEADRGIQKKKNLTTQWEFLKKAADQIKAEMKRQKELQREELQAAIKQKELSRLMLKK